MVYKSHYVELFVNGHRVELESQDSVNVRFNNVLFDPTKISSTQAEYSFEFELPCTPVNNKIFDYANDLAKLNKFRPRWDAELYADGNLIFSGTLTLNSVKDRMYNVNLVSVKVNSLDDIFGEAVMTDIKINPDGDKWEIPFNGAGFETSPYTIDYYNKECAEGRNSEVCFPLISYGVFEKDPVYNDDVGSTYTSKYDLDKYNRWYVESFFPSISMLETMKKAFEWKGYSVGGDAFQDSLLKEVFMSTNLADGQDPTYNLANPKFGKLELEVGWETPINGSAYTQSLDFPYFRVGGVMKSDGKCDGSQFNFSDVQLYDMLSEGNVTVANSSYLYQPNEHIIVIPADGFYKITLSGETHISTAQTSFQANQWYMGYITEPTESLNMGEVEIPVSMRKYMPVEIQLVRNYDDNLELIKGENNFYLYNGVPGHDTFAGHINHLNMTTTYPHEKPGCAYRYVEDHSLVGYADGWTYALPTNMSRFGAEDNKALYDYSEGNNVSYLFNDGDIMAYDPAVSPIFICGFSSMGNENGGGCASVIKNGYSWSQTVSERYDSFYPQYGNWKSNTSFITNSYGRKIPSWNLTTLITTHNQNTYNGSFNYYSSNENAMRGQIQCMVKLNKGDVLQLYAVQREYTHDNDQCQYKIYADYKLTIEAASPKSYEALLGKFDYNSPSQFDTNLNLANFFNKEKKVSEWIQNCIDAFNLELIQDNKSVIINTRRKYVFDATAVDVDNRVNSNEAESSAIDYPRSMAVKYKINEDEWGFERSAVENAGEGESVLDRDDWKKYADSGYSEIILNDDTYVTNKSEKSLQYSYTWYWDFNWYEVDVDGQQNPYRDPVVLRIPCISKFQYMVDGYGYEESMKHDGYNLPQRFWFRPKPTECYVYTETYPKEMITIYTTENEYNGINLSYKNTERSLLTEFFNISAYLSSNYVEIEVYLTPDEYNRLKNGALVRFDKDLYWVVSIDGYSPTGNDPTTIKIMKKVV